MRWALNYSRQEGRVETMRDSLRLIAVQFNPKHKAVDENRDFILKRLKDMRDALVVFPELSTTGYSFTSRDELVDMAETLDGDFARELKSIAVSNDLVIVVGVPELAEGKLYNSAFIIAPDRSPETYRKVHLFYREKDVFEPGDEFKVFDVRVGEVGFKLGVMICFDWAFPESARTLALRGADIIAHPANLVLPYCPRVMPARALENRVFTVTANRVGTEMLGNEQLSFIGSSIICSPKGEVIAKADKEEYIEISATVNPLEARNKTLTKVNDIFADRRPSVYEC